MARLTRWERGRFFHSGGWNDLKTGAGGAGEISLYFEANGTSTSGVFLVSGARLDSVLLGVWLDTILLEPIKPFTHKPALMSNAVTTMVMMPRRRCRRCRATCATPAADSACSGGVG